MLSFIPEPPTVERATSSASTALTPARSGAAMARKAQRPQLAQLNKADSWTAPSRSLQPSTYTSLVGGFGLSKAPLQLPALFVLLTNAIDGHAFHRRADTPWVIHITGPGRVHVALTDHDDGTTTVRYTCSCSGQHRITIRLGEAHLAGSPFIVDVDVAIRHNPALLALTKAQATLRGLFVRWATRSPATRYSAPVAHDAIRPRAASNAWALEELLKRMQLMRTAIPHLEEARRRKGLEAFAVHRQAVRALAKVAVRVMRTANTRRVRLKWARWLEFCDERHTVLQLLDRYAAMADRLDARRLMEHGLACWRECKAEADAAHAAHVEDLQRADTYSDRQCVAYGMRRWKGVSREATQMAREHKSIGNAAERHLRSRRSMALVAAMEKWRTLRTLHAAALRDLQWIGFRMESKRKWLLGAAVRTWLSFVSAREGSARLDLRSEAPYLRQRQRDLRAAVAFWRDLSAQSVQEATSFDFGARAHRALLLRGSFANWRLLRVPLHQLEWATRHINFQRMRRAQRAWLLHTVDCMRTARTIRFGEARVAGLHLHRAVEMWRRAAARWALGARGAAHTELKDVARAFACIRAGAARDARGRRSDRVALAHHAVRSVGPAFLCWLKRCRERAWLAACVPRTTVIRLHLRALANGFQHWRGQYASAASIGFRTRQISARRARQLWRYGFYTWEAVVQPRSLEAQLRRIQRAGRVLVAAPSWEETAQQHQADLEPAEAKWFHMPSPHVRRKVTQSIRGSAYGQENKPQRRLIATEPRPPASRAQITPAWLDLRTLVPTLIIPPR